jgi:hypothetical protein
MVIIIAVMAREMKLIKIGKNESAEAEIDLVTIFCVDIYLDCCGLPLFQLSII